MSDGARRVDVISRSAALLSRLALSADGLGVRELATEIGLPKSTVLRLLQGLEEVGFVVQHPATRLYKIGPLAFRLGLAFVSQTRIRDRALPHMRSLNELTGETVGLNIRIGDKRVLIEQVESASALLARAELGDYPAHMGAPGRILLAELATTELNALLDADAGAALSTDDRAALIRDLENVRAEGIARASDETVMGLASIAAPVRDASGTVTAALGVSAPSFRFDYHAMRKLEPPLAETALHLSRELGYQAT